MAFMKRTLLVTVPLLAAALGSACVVSVDSQAQIVREEKRFKVSGTPELHLTTFDGAIEIQATDGQDVSIDVEKRGATKEVVDGLEIVTTQDGNKITLEVKRPRAESFSGLGFHQSSSARLIVSVPRDTNIVARSGDGSSQWNESMGASSCELVTATSARQTSAASWCSRPGMARSRSMAPAATST